MDLKSLSLADRARAPRRGGRRRPLRREARPARVALAVHRRRGDLARRVAGRLAPGRRRRVLQRRRLHLARLRRPRVLGRLPHRPADHDDDGRRDLRVADGARLHHRLHGRGPGLHALLQLHLALHLLDAHARHEQQLRPAVLRLGGGRAGVLPADRLLVHAADGHLREPEGVPRQPRRRLRLRARHRARARLHRLARLRGRVRQGARARRTVDARAGGRARGR